MRAHTRVGIIAPMNLLGMLLAITSALCFSTLGLWGKIAQNNGLNSSNLLVWRFGLVALLLFGLGYGGNHGFAARARMVFYGLLYFVFTALYFAALERIPAGLAALLVYLAPVAVVLIHTVLGRAPSTQQLLATALAIVGIAVIVFRLQSLGDLQNIQLGSNDRALLGMLFGALAGLGYGLYLVLTESNRVAPLEFTAHSALGSALGFAIWTFSNAQMVWPTSRVAWLLIAAMTVVSTLCALPMLYAAINRIGAARTSVISTLEPVFITVLAFVFLQERIHPSAYIGGALVLAGAILSSLGATTPTQPSHKRRKSKGQ